MADRPTSGSRSFSIRRGFWPAMLTGALSLALLAGTPSAAHAENSLGVTATTVALAGSQTSTALTGLAVTGSAPTTTIQVTVATDVGTIAMPVDPDVTLAYNNHWVGDQSVTMSGQASAVNAELGATALVTGNDAGSTAHVSITALGSQPGYVFSAKNGHFFQYVASNGITWDAANTAAGGQTFAGQTGYLAAIPDDDINNLISTHIEGAHNVWFGARSTDTFTSSPTYKRTWKWVGGPRAGDPISYCSSASGTCNFANNSGLYSHWASGEPNDYAVQSTGSGSTKVYQPYSGEWVAVTNWQGSVGNWNDLKPSNTGTAGYVVEYGDLTQGATSFSGVVTASSDVVISDAPAAPTGVSAVRGDGSASVSFVAPAEDGGSAITGYTVTVAPGGATFPCSASPCQVPGLTNGSAYTFTIHATNAVGDSAESTPSDPVTPASVPAAPTNAVATKGDGSASVAFVLPLTDGGAQITSFTVTSYPGGITGSCHDTPCDVSGLTNGVSYTFTVHATNAVGDSLESAASAAVTPGPAATVPGAPTGVVAVAGDGSASVSFVAPAEDGGSAITGYTVTSSPGEITASCSQSPCDVSGLVNGTAYTFTVHATNVVGDSPESSASKAVTPAAVPGAPTGVAATVGNGSASVSFVAPVGDGGSAVTSYTVTSAPGGFTSTCSASPCVVSGLSNGRSYTFTVVATNAVGDSAGSEPSAAVVPVTLPSAPTAVTAVGGNGSATVSFTASDDGGSAITGYTVTTSPGGAISACSASPCHVTGLTNGDSYTFTVHATTAVGDSAESAPSNAVTPATVPGAPRDLSVVAGNKSATVTFGEPLSDGGSAVTGYRVTSSPGGVTATCPTSPCVVTGLTNGTVYTFRVHATNAVGNSAESAKSGPAFPVSVPSAPTAVSAVRGNGSATVTFTESTDDGGIPIGGYTVTSAPGGHSASCRHSPCLVTGLTNGVSYVFTVHASNEVGVSPESDPSNAVTPVTVPAMPVNLQVKRSRGAAHLQFLAPDDVGGSQISSYQVSIDGGGTWSTLSTSGNAPITATVTGLANGTSYAIEVRARNEVGAGEAAAADPVTPADVPDAPTQVTGTRGTAR